MGGCGFDGTRLGDCWAVGGWAYGLLWFVALDGDAVWRFWMKCGFAGDCMGCA